MDFAALQHSVFLQALGSAILNSLWQCFIVWLIYETVSASYKTASARFKNNLATVLLFFSFTWFLTSFISKIFYQPRVSSVIAMQNGFAAEPHAGVHTVSGFNEFLSYASASLPYLSVAYIFLLAFLISRLFAAYRYVYFISNKRLMNPTGELQLFASKVAAEIGITKKIGVWISHHIDVPATIGFFKPVILIPLASINNLSAPQLEAIILHELAHIRRNDYITNLVISVIETILFFNPFIVLLSNIIKRERENCCDDFVLQYRYDPHSYASALLRLEQSRVSKITLAIGAVSGKKQLLSRIKRITNSQVVSRQFNYGQKIIALLLVTAVICSVAWLSPEEKKSVAEKPSAKNKEVTALSKEKSAEKAQSAVGATTPGKPIEALPPVNVRHAVPKSEPTPPELADNNSDNIPYINAQDEDSETKDDEDVATGEDNIDLSGAVNVNQPVFSFDENNFKLPSFIGIQNFLYQNMKLDIDLSKIDMGKLNKNLKRAYKEINGLDWSKVQKDIEKSFGKINHDKLSQQQQEEIFSERAKTLAGENLIRARQLYFTRANVEEIKNEFLKQDSLHLLELKVLDNKSTKLRRVYNKLQRDYKANSPGNSTFYYNYSNTTDGDNDSEDAKKLCDQKNGSPGQGKKTVQISIRRGPNDVHTGVLTEKKGFQLSFSGNGDERPNHESVISVEIND